MYVNKVYCKGIVILGMYCSISFQLFAHIFRFILSEVQAYNTRSFTHTTAYHNIFWHIYCKWYISCIQPSPWEVQMKVYNQ